MNATLPTRDEVIDLARQVVNAPLLPIDHDEIVDLQVVSSGQKASVVTSHMELQLLGAFRPDVGYETGDSYVRYRSLDYRVEPHVGIGMLVQEDKRLKLLVLNVDELTANMAQEMITHLYSVLESALAPATV